MQFDSEQISSPSTKVDRLPSLKRVQVRGHLRVSHIIRDFILLGEKLTTLKNTSTVNAESDSKSHMDEIIHEATKKSVFNRLRKVSVLDSIIIELQHNCCIKSLK